MRSATAPAAPSIHLAQPQPGEKADPGKVLAKATRRASEMLGLSKAGLAKTLGLSEATVLRILRGERGIKPESKEGELALLLVRVSRALDAMMGADAEMRLVWMWMGGSNGALGGRPIQLVQRVEGLVAVLSYLEGRQASC